MMTLDDLRAMSCIPDPRFIRTSYRLATAALRLAGVRIEAEGARSLGSRPVLLASNHTHEYDFLPLRWFLYDRFGTGVSTWIKPRAYAGLAGFYLKRTGNIPVASRGYVIAVDFSRTLGRRPTEAEYRALRDHVDDGATLPDAGALAAITSIPRQILGHDFDPRRASYRDAIHATFARMMDITLAHSRRTLAAGQTLHIYPQGTITPRLTPSRTGAIQAAIALDIPVVPVGISGVREVWPEGKALPRRGNITIRFGTPRRVHRPAEFSAFRKATEIRHRAFLEAEAARLTDDIEGLLDPSYRRDHLSDMPHRGIARFV